MGINEADFNRLYLESAGYSSTKNTVHNVSSPVNNSVWEKSLPAFKLPEDTFEKEPPKKEKTKTPSKKVKPAKDEIKTTINFMGEQTNMTGRVIKNADGTYEHYLASDEGGICIIKYDKDGKMLSMSQELTTGDKYKYISSEFDPKTNISKNTSINKNMTTGAISEYNERIDKDGNKLNEQTYKKEDGKETTTFKQYDKEGNEKEVTTTVNDGINTTISSAEVTDSERGIVREEENVYNNETSEHTSRLIESKENENGETVVIKEETSESKNGITKMVSNYYNDDGTLRSEHTSTRYPDGRLVEQNARLNSDNTISETEVEFNHSLGSVNQYTKTTDQNNRLVSESTFIKNNGVTTQEHQRYNADGQVISHGLLETGKGVMNDTQSRINENGEWETKRTMMLNGQRYDDEAAFQKDVEEHLKK